MTARKPRKPRVEYDYVALAKMAREEGFSDIADWFYRLARKKGGRA